MGSTYPSGYDHFTDKTDNTDINYAADINRIQDAVEAVQSTLGAGILSFLNSNYVANDDSGILSYDPAGDTQGNSSSVTTGTTNFAAVVDYLTYLRRNQASVAASFNVKSQWSQPITGDFSATLPPAVTLVDPGPNGDPDDLYNGIGFTIPKSGLWQLEGHIQYALTADVTANGTYQAAISLGTNDWTTGLARSEVTQGQNFGSGKFFPTTLLAPRRLQWISAGTVVALRSSHSSYVPQRIASGFLSGVLLRQS